MTTSITVIQPFTYGGSIQAVGTILTVEDAFADLQVGLGRAKRNTTKGLTDDTGLPVYADPVTDQMMVGGEKAKGALTPSDVGKVSSALVTGELVTADSGKLFAGGALAPSSILRSIGNVPTVAVIGDSISANQVYTATVSGYVGTTRYITMFGAWAQWAVFNTDGRCVLDPYACEGYSGKQTGEILAALQTSFATETFGASGTRSIGVQARTPNIVFDVSGTNDIIFAGKADIDNNNAMYMAIAGRRQIWSFIKACGGVPVAMSLLPHEGSYATSDDAYTQDELTAGGYITSWNSAMKAAALEDGVYWVDGYAVCANSDGTWKDGYIFKNGADDAYGIHPSMLASYAIGQVAADALLKVLGNTTKIPRIYKGDNPAYSASFIASDNRQYFSNFTNTLFDSVTPWAIRYNPQSAGIAPYIDSTSQDTQGGTIVFSMPAASTAEYCDWHSDALPVEEAQEYIFFCDAKIFAVDGYSGISISIVDATSGSSSIYQSIAQYSLSAKYRPLDEEFESEVVRCTLKFAIPASITTVRCLVSINRGAGGADEGTEYVKVSNMGMLRTL